MTFILNYLDKTFIIFLIMNIYLAFTIFHVLLKVLFCNVTDFSQWPTLCKKKETET